MNKLSTLLLIIISVILVILFAKKPSGADQRLIELDKKYNQRLDSITSVYRDSLHKRELQALKAFSEAERAKDRALGEANTWKARYNNEKNSNRTFTDKQLDSLVIAIR